MEKIMKPQRNKGYVIRGKDSFAGRLNIDGVILDIIATFWSKTETNPPYIWVTRTKEKLYDSNTNSFKDYEPKPILNIVANKTKRSDFMNYRGEFIFLGFKFNLVAFWEDKSEKKLNFEVERCDNQPIIERLKELKKNSI